jgi:hypothetical protein
VLYSSSRAHQPETLLRNRTASSFTMGKSDEKQIKKRAHKATTDGESKHKNNKPSVDATDFEATDNDEGLRHSRWRDQFRQLCEYKVQIGHCLVPNKYTVNPKAWVLGCYSQRIKYRWYIKKERQGPMTAERTSTRECWIRLGDKSSYLERTV